MVYSTASLSKNDDPVDLHRFLFGVAPQGGTGRRVSGVQLKIAADSIDRDPDYPALLARLSGLARKSGAEKSIIKALSDELGSNETIRFIDGGTHRVSEGITVASGSAVVEATGEGFIFVLGRASVTARGACRLFACDDTTVALYGRVRAFVTGSAEVKGSYDRVRGHASGQAHGVARGQSVWIVSGNAEFDGFDGSWLYADDNAKLRAYGAHARVRGKATASLFAKSIGWFEGLSQGEVHGEAHAYAKPSTNVRPIGVEARVITVPSHKPLTCREWPEW